MKLNGSIPNINLGLSVGVIGLLIFTIIVGGYYITQVKDASEYNQKQIKTVRENQDAFTKHVIDQQDSTDKVNNASRHLQIEQENQLLNLSRANDIVIHKQLANEQHLINISDISQEQEKQILGLARNQSLILRLQVENLKQILNNTNNTLNSIALQELGVKQRNVMQDNILGNLTALQNTTIQNQQLIKSNQELVKNTTASNLNLTIHNKQMLDDTNEDVNKLMELLNNNTLGK